MKHPPNPSIHPMNGSLNHSEQLMNRGEQSNLAPGIPETEQEVSRTVMNHSELSKNRIGGEDVRPDMSKINGLRGDLKSFHKLPHMDPTKSGADDSAVIRSSKRRLARQGGEDGKRRI